MKDCVSRRDRTGSGNYFDKYPSHYESWTVLVWTGCSTYDEKRFLSRRIFQSHDDRNIGSLYVRRSGGGGEMGRSGDSRFGADFRYIALEELSSPKRYEIVSFLTYLTAKQPQNRYSFSTFNPSTVSSHLAVRERERERGLVVNTMRGSEKPKEADRWG